MADVKITQLPQASLPLTGSEVFPLVQNGVTVKTPVGSINVASNISALRTTTPADNQIINVEGYYANGDGGGGQFYGVTGGSYTDNGGTIITPNGGTDTSAWIRLPADYLDVRWFGAKGDGLTDDTTALTNCIAVANVFGSDTRVVRITAGRYKFSTTLNIFQGVSLIGDNSQDNNTVNFQTALEYYGTGWAIVTYSNSIKSIDIKSKGSSQSGIYVLGGLVGVFENVNIIDFSETALRIGSASAGGGSYAQSYNSVNITSNSTFGKIALLIDGGILPNSNANFLSNIYLSGKWKTFADIRGNTNQINALALELLQGNPEEGWIDTGINLRGLNNVIATPYIERFPTAAALENRTQTIRFCNQWTPISFTANPVENDTITITGFLGSPAAVTITFRAVPVAATDVQIGADVSTTMANLTALINGSANPTLASISASITLDSVAAYEVMLELRANTLNQWSILSVSSIAAFKSATTWSRSQYNKVYDAYLPYLPYGISGSTFYGGSGNNISVGYSGSQFGQNISYSNLVSNADLRILNASNVPTGWVVTSGGAFGGTVTRTTTKTRNSPYCLEMTCAATRALATFNIYTATVANQQINQVPLGYLIDQDLTIGIWCWSDTAGFGAIQINNGVLTTGGPSHSGLSRWEFLSTSYRVDSSSTSLLLRITNSAASVASTGTCYFCSPMAFFGIGTPQDNTARFLDDSDAALAGRLAWNPPAIISGISMNVSEGNFFKVTNAGATNLATLSNGKIGQEVKLLFTNGNTTVVNTGNIIPAVAGARAANSVAQFIYDGTSWYEM